MARSAVARGILIEAGRRLLVRSGVGAVSMRAVAEACSYKLSTVQYHFRDPEDLARHVIHAWASDLKRAIEAQTLDSMGLMRAARLSHAWLNHPEAAQIPLDAIRYEPRRHGREGVRGMLLSVLEDWVDETHRSLRQAAFRNELLPGVDPRHAAIDIHRIVWSKDWAHALYGEPFATSSTLRTLWAYLLSLAAEPAKSLPNPDEFLGLEARAPPLRPAPDEFGLMPNWRLLLKPEDPLFHAFERHQVMGDQRTFVNPPEVLPIDEEAARNWRADSAAAQT